MEEVDRTTSQSLRQLDVDIYGNDVKKISDQPIEVVESATKCISDIDTTRKVPIKSPSGVSQRIEVAAQTASICKDSGYQNDVGYQTYLYHNGTEKFRQGFRIQKLPSEDKTQTAKVQSVNKNHTLFKDISSIIAKGLNAIRVLLCCRPSTQSIAGDFAHNKAAMTKIESDGIDDMEKLHQDMSKTQQMLEEMTATNSYLKVRIEELKSLNSLSETDGTKCRNTLENLKDKWQGNVDEKYAGMEKTFKNITDAQKQINTLQLELGTCLFEVQDAKTFGEAKRTYKLLALLQSECNRLVTFANTTNTLYRDTIDLKDDLEAEMSKLPEDTLKKIKSDVAKLQKED